MGKKGTDQDATPNAGAVVNKDLMQRMNFLYQIASHLSQHPPLPNSNQIKSSNGKKKGKRKGTLQDLASFHVRTMKTIGNKSMVKMDPSVKRTICKVCQTVMLPGQSSRVRVKSSRSHRFVKSQRCENCGWTSRIPNPPHKQEDEEMNAPGDDKESPRARATDLSQRERNAARAPPLYEREGHVVFVSNQTRKAPQTPRAEGMGGSKVGKPLVAKPELSDLLAV